MFARPLARILDRRNIEPTINSLVRDWFEEKDGCKASIRVKGLGQLGENEGSIVAILDLVVGLVDNASWNIIATASWCRFMKGLDIDPIFYGSSHSRLEYQMQGSIRFVDGSDVD
jgi:hypothetical protein